MREMSRMAVEQATEAIAWHAQRFASQIPAEISGRDALLAFADSIRSTNAKQFPKKGVAS